MPIRMVDDPNDPNAYDPNDRRRPNPGGGGGGGGIFNLLPLLLMLFRRPGGWVLLLLAVAAYFLFGQKGCGGLMSDNAAGGFATGGMLDKNEFAKAPVYEGLTADDIRNPLPDYVSLAKFAPPRQNQGEQGSCVAWSSAYAAHTITESVAHGTNPTQQAMSPAYMYNQIGLNGCQGSYIIRAMQLMQQKGGVLYNQFPYDASDCSRNPTPLDGQAAQYRIHGFNRLTTSEDPEGINIRAIKEHLAKDAPVVVGMLVGGSFMQPMMGQKLWQPSESDYNMRGFGGHAMSVIGYDDKLAGGAFQIMNSWGPEWGENGLGWIRYKDFEYFTREAYGVDAMPKEGAAVNQVFDCEIGLVRVNEKAQPAAFIPLKASANQTFTTTATVPKGMRFKVEVKNSTPCYVYVFGQETDGSSYTLFPYPTDTDPTKTAYTAYCGITGVRLFPKNKSMTPDDVGNKDYMAIVVSKKELLWYQLNQKISANKTNYQQAVSSALLSAGANNGISVSSTATGNMRFTAPAADNGVAYAIIEINKQ